MEFSGLFVPSITIFMRDGKSVDTSALQEHVGFLLGMGVHGLIANGTTGDFHLLTLEERKLTAETVLARVAGKVPVIVGTSSLTTADTIMLCAHAQDHGAAGVMVAPPYYLPMTSAEIVSFYGRVASAIKIPLILYNNPGCTGQHITADIVIELESSIGLRYVKESSGVYDNFQRILSASDQRVKVFMGEESLSVQALLMGAAGIIMGLANAIPDRFMEILRAVRDNDIARCRSLHYQTLPVYAAANLATTHNYNSVIKSILKIRRGLDITASRSPSLPLTPDQEVELAELLARAEIGSLSQG